MPTGKYFVKCEPAKTHKLVDDKEARHTLWAVCSDFLGGVADAA